MDEFQHWRDSLAGHDMPIHADVPQSGYYRMREGKTGRWLPVAIWTVNSKRVCRVGNEARDPSAVWTFCAGNPVSKDAAKQAFETGEWPGDAPAIGHNSGDLTLAEQIKEYAAMALGWLRKSGITDKVSLDTAANYRAELLRLGKEADAQRASEKKPHDDAAKAVQAKWKPIVDEADLAANALRQALTLYMREEERRLEAERRAKWLAEQKAAEDARKAAEAERAKQMRDDPIAALTSPDPELPMTPPPPEPVKVQAGGQRGRKTGLREVTVYTVTDHAACLAFFAEHEETKALVAKLAERVAKTGVAVPGLTISKEKVAA